MEYSIITLLFHLSIRSHLMRKNFPLFSSWYLYRGVWFSFSFLFLWEFQEKKNIRIGNEEADQNPYHHHHFPSPSIHFPSFLLLTFEWNSLNLSLSWSHFNSFGHKWLNRLPTRVTTNKKRKTNSFPFVGMNKSTEKENDDDHGTIVLYLEMSKKWCL